MMAHLVTSGGWARWAAAAVVAAGVGVRAGRAQLPWDHVVIVIEENHDYGQVIGSASAPYITSLAANGANFTNLYALTHPSQPNYLELFSGANQGVTTDNVPSGTPFTTANLGAELIAAGKTFAGYSESMPSVGYTGASYTTVTGQNQYMQKHNPWVQWQANTPGTNQLLPTTNQPFAAFPAAGSYASLPTLSFVVPNEQNDMHDGSVAQGDSWLQTNLGAYATWAKSNNSLLVVTFDEDAGTAGNHNRIPTLFYGANVKTGTVDTTWTLHHLLRTMENAYGTTHAGAAANASGIVGAVTADPVVTTARFSQNNASGYTGAQDTYIEAANPTTVHNTATPLVVDGSPLSQGLVRFDGIFGDGAGQVPAGAHIVSAKLRVLTGSTSGDSSADSFGLYRMLTHWTDQSTWSTFGGDGVQTNDVEAASVADDVVLPNTLDTYGIFDVTATLQMWANNPALNEGWLIKDLTGTDGWRFGSAEGAGVPYLEITYEATSAPEPATALLGGAGLVMVGMSRRVRPRRGR